MKTETPASSPILGGGRSRWIAFVAAICALAVVPQVPAQAPAAPGNAAVAPASDELEKLVGRIALYPDDLIAIILPAATNPLQLVQADRYLEKRKADPKAPLDQSWDDAVKSLLNYPEVVKMMSGDLDWTVDIGEAVVADQGEVLEAVQTFRRKTQAAGNLKTDAKQTVVVEKEVIKIVPADPQVMYVPQYNPSSMYVYGGYSAWGYYPSPYPVYYYPYPPGAALATGIIWGAALGAIWNGGRYGANYGGGNNNINIDRSTNVNIGSGNVGSGNRPTPTGGGSSQWKSNKQPGQVSSGTGRTQSTRAGDAGSRGGAGSAGRASTQPSGGGLGGGGANRASPSTGAGGGSFGGSSANRASPSTGASGGAFGGSNSSARQTQMDSSRGAASRGASSSSFSGGARSGGFSGGGARGGGGGGRRR